MNILIIDDETKARSLLRNIIEQGCEFENEIREASNLAEGVVMIQDSQPDLLFLDIEMPDSQGTEIFDLLDTDTVEFEIVFTTAYNQYALTAFEMNAIDYLLKPLRPNKVIDVIRKVRQSKDKEQISNRLEELKNSLSGKKFNKIGLPVSDGILFIPLENIVHLEAAGMYTNFYTDDGEKLVVSKPLKYFDFLVEAESVFYRPHRSHIFNLHFLKQYVKKGGNYLLLENEHIVPVSKDKREDLLDLISTL